jgi:hypothetical protein
MTRNTGRTVVDRYLLLVVDTRSRNGVVAAQ